MDGVTHHCVPFCPTPHALPRWPLLPLCPHRPFPFCPTPWQVALLEIDLNALFWLNRMVDFVFLCDVWVNFRMMYVTRTSTPASGCCTTL
jgi:hypothetical protein